MVGNIGRHDRQLNRAALCLACFCLVIILHAVRDERHNPLTNVGQEFRARLAPARETCSRGLVGFHSDRETAPEYSFEWYSSQYVLAPAVVIPDNLKWFSFAAVLVTHARGNLCQILSIHSRASDSIGPIGPNDYVEDLGAGIYLILRSGR
jgi:hypothetical protein